MATQNKTLGRFQLTDIPPAPRGIPQIEVTFDIDANGIVNVKAKDLGTGKSQSITIQNDAGLTDAEIEKMVKDAEENAEADKLLKEEADLRNEADQLIFATSKAITDLADNISDDEKKEAEEKSEELKKALEGTDLELIKTKKEELNTLAQALATKAYEQAQKAQEAAQNANGAEEQDDSTSDDDIVDAEYEEV